LFTLTPVGKHGLDKAAIWWDTYQLTLWCEYGDRPHPWRPAHYQFSKPRDWLITVAPYALGVLQILRVVVNVATPIGTLANVDLASIKDNLDAMDKLLDQLPTQLPDVPAAPGQAAQPIQADGPELRALRALLTELDPNRTFKGMHVCRDPVRRYPVGLPGLLHGLRPRSRSETDSVGRVRLGRSGSVKVSGPGLRIYWRPYQRTQTAAVGRGVHINRL